MLERITTHEQAMIYAAIARLYVILHDDTMTASNRTDCLVNELYDFGCAYTGKLSSLAFGTDPDEYLVKN